MHFTPRKGQGSLELLMLMGAVVIVATLVITTLISTSGQGTTATNTSVGGFTSTIEQFRNQPPYVLLIRVLVNGAESSTAANGDDLVCDYILGDADGDPTDRTNSVVRWYQNGLLYTAFIPADGEDTILPNSHTQPADTWYCEVTPAATQGQIYGQPLQSGNVAIDAPNSPPTVNAGTTYSGPKGTWISLHGTLSDESGIDPSSVLWSLSDETGCMWDPTPPNDFETSTGSSDVRVQCSACFGNRVLNLYGEDTTGVGNSGNASLQVTGCGSCPFVYSFDGERYVREHEAIPMATLKTFEGTSHDALRHLKPVNGKVQFRIAEELPEISFLRDVTLTGIRTKEGTTVFPDSITGALHTASFFVHPSSCTGKDGSSCLEAVKEVKETVWVSDAQHIVEGKEESYEDYVDLEFPVPGEVQEGKLFLYIKGTEYLQLGSYFIAQLGDNWIGGATGITPHEQLFDNEWLRERAREVVQEEIAIQLFVWDGEQWVAEASHVPTTNMWDETFVALPVRERKGGTIKIRVAFNTGFYALDYAGMDFSEDAIEESHPLSLAHISYPGALQEFGTGSYAVLEQGEAMNLTYDGAEEDMQYVVSVSGFYHVLSGKERSVGEYVSALLEITPSFLLEKNYMTKHALPAMKACDEFNGAAFVQCMVHASG